MMGSQLGSEIRKSFTQQSWWLLGAVMVLFSAGLAAIYLMAGLHLPRSPLDFGEVEHLQTVYSVAATQAFVFAALTGALTITGELQSRTMALTLLANPHREQVLWGKVLVAAGTGLLHGLAALAVTTGFAAVMLSTEGFDPMLIDPEILVGLAGSAVSLAVWAVVGVALGALIQNQLGAVLGPLLFIFLVEPGLQMLLPDSAVPYLPSNLADAAAGGTSFGSSGVEGLAQWAALGAIVVLAAVLCTAAVFRFRRVRVH